MAGKTRDHFLVFAQFLGIALCFYPVGPINIEVSYYLIISVFGMLGGIATLLYNKIGNFNVYPQVKKNAELITSGPYTHIRHPMYLSLILVMLGVVLFNFHYQSIIGFSLLITAISLKIVREEKLLIKSFPEYRQYMTHTKRFVLWVW